MYLCGGGVVYVCGGILCRGSCVCVWRLTVNC